MRTTFIPAAQALLPTPIMYCEMLEPFQAVQHDDGGCVGRVRLQCDAEQRDPRSLSTMRASASDSEFGGEENFRQWFANGHRATGDAGQSSRCWSFPSFEKIKYATDIRQITGFH